MAMTPEQKRRMRAAFDELDLMSASRSDEEFEDKEEVGVLTDQDQKRKVETQPPKQSLPVVSATQDSLTTALANDEPDTRRKIYTETTTTPTGGSRFTTTDPNQTQEGFRAERAVRGVFNEFRNMGNPIEVIEKLGREQVRQMMKRDGGEAAVQIFDKQYPE
tara:strand:- start:51 stop:536 length:486 start_codon:yes stop_codon:yes gene_type:complete